MVHFKELLTCLIFTLIVLARICCVGANPDLLAKVKEGLDSGVVALDSIANLGNTKVFEKIGKFAGSLGAVGGILSLALMFVDTESEELILMKAKFAEMNRKLDGITTKLDKLENVIKLENQRSAYIQYAYRITTGYKELQNFVNELHTTNCSSKQGPITCAKIAERYVKHFNVKGDLLAILTGALRGTAPFGDPLLKLVQTRFKCNVSKIESYSSSMFFLAFRAQLVILAYEGLKGSNHSAVQSMYEWLGLIYQLRDATNKEKKFCYDRVKRFIIEEINDVKYQREDIKNKEANRMVQEFLAPRYKWLDWVVYSYNAFGGKKHAMRATRKLGKFWSSPAKEKDRKRNIIVGPIDKYGTYEYTKNAVLKAIGEIFREIKFEKEKNDAMKIQEKLVENLKRKGTWKFINIINVLRKYENLEIPDNSSKFINKEYHLSPPPPIPRSAAFGNGRLRPVHSLPTIRLVVLLKSKEMPTKEKCSSRTCNDRGSCIYLPLSSKKLCQCDKFYEGESCEEHDKIKLAKTIADMFKATLKVPMLSDIKHDIENMQKYIVVGLGKIQTAISELELVFQGALKSLADKITNELKWSNLVTQYSSSIRKISYYSYLFENLPKSHPNNTKIEGRKFATEILALNGIEKWLYEINFLFLGRSGLPLVSHQPLIVHLLEKNKNQPCDKRYKSATNGTLNELVLLQQIGFMVWSQALEYAGRHTQQVASLYERRLVIQVKKLKEISCRYEIANANKTRCANGEYLNADLKTAIKCKKNHYISGPANMTSCENRPSLCKPCNCNPNGSKTLQCDNKTGNCTCKPPFYGKKCENRDCSLEWSSYSNCSKSCGFGTKKREQVVKFSKQGEGKSCPVKKKKSTQCFERCCYNKFQCSKGECIPKSQKCDYLIDCKNEADEKYCSERCFTRHTSWRRYYGRGQILLWPNNKMQCGGSGLVLQKFKQEKRAYRVRYTYTCCKLFSHPTICKNRQKSNKRFFATHHSLVSLAKQSVKCGTKSFINNVHLKKSGAYFRYTYNCCELKSKYHSCCKKMFTKYSKIRFGVAKLLGRHSVQCPHRYFISSFHLTMDKSKKKWRYNFICCKLLPQ